MKILYLKSYMFYILIYYIIGYRKQVVLENLKLAFPKKPEAELFKIRKKFFKHLMNLMFESIKGLSISQKEILKRFRYSNPDLVNKYVEEGRSIALVGSHFANWEWVSSASLMLDGKVNGTYTLIENKFINKISSFTFNI